VRFKLRKELELLDRHVGPGANRVLVDVGVGWGDHLPHLLERGFAILTLDNVQTNLARIERLKPSGCPLALVAADAHWLPLTDSSADVVLMGEILEHLVAPDRALREAHRILKPGGRLFVDVPWGHELYRPLSAVGLRTLHRFKTTGKAPALLRLFFATSDGRLRLRTYAKPLIRTVRLLPPFRTLEPETFIDQYVRGELQGDYHRQFFFPNEWQRTIAAAGFRVRVVTGAWLALPFLDGVEVVNKALVPVERRLGDRILSKIGQILVIEAVKG
jgi:SAM-dependent methyltransferase